LGLDTATANLSLSVVGVGLIHVVHAQGSSVKGRWGGVCPCNRRNEDEADRDFIVGLVVPFKRTVQCHTLVVHTLPPKRTKLIGTTHQRLNRSGQIC
jgi:hypothetical protein